MTDKAPAQPLHPVLRRLKARAKLVLFIQKVWPRLVLFSSLALLLAVLVFSGILPVLPLWLRLGVLIGLLMALVVSLVHVSRLDLPEDEEAFERIDAGSGRLSPARSLTDAALLPASASPALWEAHRLRLEAALKKVRVAPPKPNVASLDRFSLRFLVVLVAVPVLVSAYGHYGDRLRQTFALSPLQPAPFRFDAYATPPAYTGRAPILLPRRRDESVSLPRGSVIALRYSGTEPMKVEAGGALRAAESDDGARHYHLDGDGHLIIALPDGKERLRFSAIEDRAPTIAFEGEIEADGKNHLGFRYRLSDDYGVKEVQARLRLKDRKARRALIPPPDFPLPQREARLKSGSYAAKQDLSAHPWAGLLVEMQLVARDDAGQEGQSEWVTTRLPERFFNQPLARMLMDQRRDLALDAGAKTRLLRVYEALMTAPNVFAVPSGQYLMLSLLEHHLRRAETVMQLRAYLDDLQGFALAIEEGDASKLERDVQAAAEALREAMQRGASPEEIKRLTERLREAMRQLNREMAEQARRNGAQQQAQKPPPGAKMLRESDIQKLLDRIEELNRQGASEQAQRLMDELQQMLRDMEEARRNGQMVTEEDGGADAMRELSDMIRRQQQLRDETFRKQQQERQKGRRAQKPDAADGDILSDGELSKRQQDLADQLDNLSQELGPEGEDGASGSAQDAPQGQSRSGGQGDGSSFDEQARRGFGQARRGMREAGDAIKRGDRQGALDAQNRAIRGLQQGQQALSDQARRNGQGGQQQGRTGQGAGEGHDPLGRPGRRRGFSDGDDTAVPGESAAQRAQRLLDELRRRSGDINRPPLELDYIDRLLKGVTPH